MLYQQIEQFFEEREKIGVRPGLNRMNRLLDFVGHPEKNVALIHIAGTNGKGSTSQFIQSALLANNYKVGAFTSPTLVGLTGFIQINQQAISNTLFTKFFNQLLPEIRQLEKEDNPPSNFEILTVLSFMCFDKHVDIAIIETGMGGREDSTNVISPILSIITTVSYDHMAFLGDTLEKIAGHKAGIIKPLTPVITGVKGEVLQVVRHEADEKQSPLFVLDKAFRYDPITSNTFEWVSDKLVYQVKLKMNGEHQHYNASLALYAVRLLSQEELTISMPEALNGIENAMLPGRLEMIHQRPSIIVDGAHNLEGIQAFVDSMHGKDSSNHHILFAAFKDKDILEMVHCLESNFTNISITTFNHPRAQTMKDMKQMDMQDDTTIVSNWKDYMDDALTDENGSYSITGSLHFIAMVREYVLAKQRNM